MTCRFPNGWRSPREFREPRAVSDKLALNSRQTPSTSGRRSFASSEVLGTIASVGIVLPFGTEENKIHRPSKEARYVEETSQPRV